MYLNLSLYYNNTKYDMVDFFEAYIQYCKELSKIKPNSYLKYSDGDKTLFYHNGILRLEDMKIN